MARNAYRKKNTKRRRFRRRRGAFNTVRIARSPIARRTIVKMRYCDRLPILPGTSGIATSYQYRANSAHDPDYTGIGHQPLGYDEWSTFYDRYTVLGSKITVTVVPTGASGSADTCICNLRVSEDTTTTGNMTELTEQGDTRYTIVTDSDNNGKVTLRKKFSPKRFFGVNKVMDNDDLSAPIGANPVKEAYYTFSIASLSTATSAAVVHCYVTIEYIVAFTSPKPIGQS